MKKIIITVLCTAFGVLFVLDSGGISIAVFESLQLCLNTVIPSLFAFLVLSTLLMSCGIIRGELALFVLSMTGGYPVGVKLLRDMDLPAQRAERLMMYCYCASPVFLIALHSLGLYIWLSNVSACVIFAVLCKLYDLRKPQRHALRKDEQAIPAPARRGFVECINSSGKTMLQICLMVVVFGIVSRAFVFLGVTGGTFHSLLEITNIMDLRANPALISALTSFGGVCIVFQVFAICGGRFSLRKFLLSRIPIAALSAGICRLITRNLVIEASTRPRVELSESGSLVAASCLLIMTLILLRKSLSSYE
jgi:hypothetical protein